MGFSKKDFCAKYAILPGDPGRVQKIAKHLSNPSKITQNREYNSYIGKLDGENIIVCSTGIGGPSSAIAVEELYLAGVRYFIRVGTCGGIDLNVRSGDLVIANSAIRQEGTSLHYAPIEYPATASFKITSALAVAARAMDKCCHIGVVQSKDSFYGQHSPECKPVKDELLYKWNAYKNLGVLASEMECAAIFCAAAALGAKAGCVLHVVLNQERAALGLENEEIHDTSAAIECAISAVHRLISNK